MTKIPFDIKYRPQIESGEYKVETNFGSPVEIVCWNRRDDTANKTIVGIIRSGTVEEIASWNIGGKLCDAAFPQNSDYDLFIVTPEEELTEFEKAIKDMIKPYAAWPDDIFKEESVKLLFLAREQFIKDGYVIEKKIFHDAVKRVPPEIMKEVSKNVDMQMALRAEYEKGRAEALKDLPRWRKCNQLSTGQTTVVIGYTKDEDALYRNGRVISLLDLEKLPGFKED